MPALIIGTVRAFFRRSTVPPHLTVAALRDNPWSVISHELPSDADELLLEAARLAASYCSDSEYLFMRAARAGDYVPTWWNATDQTPDAHEESEELFYFADCKLREIVALLEDVRGSGSNGKV
jgi:hypothetical protein